MFCIDNFLLSVPRERHCGSFSSPTTTDDVNPK